MSTTAARIPRSIAESPDYRLDWRCLQVDEHLKHVEAPARPTKRRLKLPSWEDDQLIIEGCQFRAGRTCKLEQELNWAYACAAGDSRTGLGARIKAFHLAGLGPEATAQRLSLPAGAVAAYLVLHFDISGCNGSTEILEALLFPPQSAPSPAEMRERLLLRTAFAFGLEGLERLLRSGRRLDQSERAEVLQDVQSVVSRGLLGHAINLESSPAGDKQMPALFRNLAEAARDAPPADKYTERTTTFGRGIFEILERKVQERVHAEMAASESSEKQQNAAA